MAIQIRGEKQKVIEQLLQIKHAKTAAYWGKMHDDQDT